MALFSELDLWRDPAPRSAAVNMAIDEVLLEFSKRPLIRFYSWNHLAVSFGYFGKFADVEKYMADRDVVRRWTGGGTVRHGEDLTYSLVIPAASARGPISSREIYTVVHEALRNAIEQMGQPAKLATAESERVSDSCFANPVAADVISGHRKVAGAAHRRTRAGLLHQGSIQNIDISAELASTFARNLSPKPREIGLEAGTIDRASQIAETKYATPAWLHRW